ncbi:MAG: ABC transporter ATP-binding protein [Ruminococcus sp.]
MAIVLQAEQLNFTFQKEKEAPVPVLNHFSLSLHTGEIVSLIGPSGCGKSTFLRLAAGLEPIQSGSLCYDGKTIQGTQPERAYVFQDANLFPWLNVYENIAFGLKARHIFKQRRAEVDTMIQRMQLNGFEKSYPSEISGGMASRVSLARTFVQKPDLILLDEPLSALDAFTRMALQDQLLKMQQLQQTTMLLVTHDIEEAIYLSDRILVLTPRPASVIAEIPISLPHPRKRTSPEVTHLRNMIMEKLQLKDETASDNTIA